MLFARQGDRILLHGSTGAGALRHVAAGAPAALAVIAVDALVVGHTTFDSSANYRSAVVHGSLTPLGDDERAVALDALSERILPGRTGEVRPMTRQETGQDPGHGVAHHAGGRIMVKTRTGTASAAGRGDRRLARCRRAAHGGARRPRLPRRRPPRRSRGRCATSRVRGFSRDHTSPESVPGRVSRRERPSSPCATSSWRRVGCRRATACPTCPSCPLVDREPTSSAGPPPCSPTSSVDLQPSGWRFTDRPAATSARARAFLRQDLDELAEAYDGYAGPLKIQVAGPWTLAASIELNRGERSITDEGARRDLVASLAEGVRRHVAEVQRLVPGAVLTVQLDEPSVLSVLRGELPTASGYGRVRAVDRAEVARGIREVREAHDGDVVLHSCHPAAPVELLAATGVTALALDLTESSPQRWEAIAAAVESGVRLWAGVVPTSAVDVVRGRGADGGRATVVEGFGRVGLPPATLADVTVTPTCGLPSLTPQGAVAVQRVAVDTARELTEKEQD